LKEFSIDSIGKNSVRLLQSKGGYRFSIDAVLLAHFIKTKPDEEGLEIGCGNGVVLVLLSHLQKFKRIVGIEVQQKLAGLAEKNLRMNRIDHAEIVNADIRQLPAAVAEQRFDFIFANPPYRKLGTGKLNPKEEKAIARHEVKMKLEDIFRYGASLLKPKGRITLILPSFRETELKKLAEANRFHWREKQYVYSFAGEKPAFILCTFSKSEGKLNENANLTIYDSPNVYTAEMKKLLNW
jgi:tRNA1Val (adenine37-N6)-methyltransferase